VAKKYLLRNELGPFLREHGYPYGDSTIAKLCSPAVNQGPPVDALHGKRTLHTPEKVQRLPVDLNQDGFRRAG
jgi:hypothetical protein